MDLWSRYSNCVCTPARKQEGKACSKQNMKVRNKCKRPHILEEPRTHVPGIYIKIMCHVPTFCLTLVQICGLYGLSPTCCLFQSCVPAT